MKIKERILRPADRRMGLHRQRGVLVRMIEGGRKLDTVRIASPAELRWVIAKAGDHPKVVLEAAY